jgi:hypothetical protein
MERMAATSLGTVNKIIPSPFRASPKRHKLLSKVPTTGIRIENSLGDEYGDKKGAHVEVTGTAKDANGDT